MRLWSLLKRMSFDGLIKRDVGEIVINKSAGEVMSIKVQELERRSLTNHRQFRLRFIEQVQMEWSSWSVVFGEESVLDKAMEEA